MTKFLSCNARNCCLSFILTVSFEKPILRLTVQIVITELDYQKELQKVVQYMPEVQPKVHSNIWNVRSGINPFFT